MRIETLPSPGLLSNSIDLRSAAARAISKIEVTASRSAGGVTSGANALHVFFTACATAVAALRDLVVPTIASRTAPATGATEVTLTYSEGLDPNFIPPTSAFVFSPVKTVSAVRVEGTKVILSLTTAVANGNTVAYTQPVAAGTLKLRDPAGNEPVSFTAAAIVVA